MMVLLYISAEAGAIVSNEKLLHFLHLFDRCETLLQIGDDVVDVLGADGETDRALGDALIGQLLFG